ncbi:MAG: hypothetical protein HQL17_06685 [Candidatus Omnitrophica bacterium]|nr:hypothetical protein [Candidatus Omnitrophota bacterium]
MAKRILWFFAGLLYPVAGFIVYLALTRLVPFLWIYQHYAYKHLFILCVIFIIVPVYGAATQWRFRKTLSIGLILGMIWMVSSRIKDDVEFNHSQKKVCSIAIGKLERYKAEHGRYPAEASLVGGGKPRFIFTSCELIDGCCYVYEPHDSSCAVYFQQGPWIFSYDPAVKKWQWGNSIVRSK